MNNKLLLFIYVFGFPLSRNNLCHFGAYWVYSAKNDSFSRDSHYYEFPCIFLEIFFADMNFSQMIISYTLTPSPFLFHLSGYVGDGSITVNIICIILLNNCIAQTINILERNNIYINTKKKSLWNLIWATYFQI
jgi:hypothetical protein